MSFDALAPHYRWMELVAAGNKLQRCRTAFLDEVCGARNVLILGEGNGRFLVECRRHLPGAQITCVDSSGRMLEQARQCLRRNGIPPDSITFMQVDALRWEPGGAAFDLIVTHFFLDCFRPDEIEMLIAKLARAAAPRADWLLADFQCPPGGFERVRAKFILWGMHVFFRSVTGISARRLTSPDLNLSQAGFELRHRRVSDWGLLHSDWWGRNS